MTTPRIHVTFKTHLDLGFTDDAHAVINGYLSDYMPKAIALAKQMRDISPTDRFVWTVGSWLISEALERLRGASLSALEQALADGDLRWHALPFTMHTEWLDEGLIRHGLALSQALDRRFGVTTRAAKMTDVPGHTIALVPLLADAGVTLLHLGVNPASTVPSVPAWSRWCHADGEVLLGYEGEYGGVSLLTPNLGLAFGFTGDNHGPPSAAEVQAFYAGLRERFPKHQIAATGLEGFAAGAADATSAGTAVLPVIDGEIGDTWIHGVGTDPEKTRRFRALARWRAALPPHQLARRELRRFSTALMMCGEHTWGRDAKCWNSTTNSGEMSGAWDAEGFAADRAAGLHERLERSWQEQRGYLDHALSCLAGSPLQAQATAASAWPVEPAGPWHELPADAPVTLEHPSWSLACAATGALNRAVHRPSGTTFADATHLLAEARYEVFGAAQYAAFIAAYNPNYDKTWRWSVADFGKPGLETVLASGAVHSPRVQRAWRHADGAALRLELIFPTADGFGCPRRWVLTIRVDEDSLAVDLRWHDKPATRVPEALWLRFNPPLAGPTGLRLVKLGREIDPRSVIAGGNRSLHACESVRWRGAGPQWNLELPDTGLIAPGGGALAAFRQTLPDPRDGLDLNLLNTTWGTNFPLWYEDDGVVRATLTALS